MEESSLCVAHNSQTHGMRLPALRPLDAAQESTRGRAAAGRTELPHLLPGYPALLWCCGLSSGFGVVSNLIRVCGLGLRVYGFYDS